MTTLHPAAQEIKPAISIRGGPPGTYVTVTMAGLRSLTPVRVGFGSLSQYEVLGGAEADLEGRVTSTFRVPEWAQADRVHWFVVTVDRKRVTSNAFHVTAADGTAHVTGTIQRSQGGCIEIEAADQTLYALEGATGTWTVGARVIATGTIAETAACEGDGVPIAVQDIQPQG